MGKIKDLWFSFTLKQKISYFATSVIAIVVISIAFNVFIVNFSLNEFQHILDDNGKANAFQEAIEMEAKVFGEYIRNRTEENKQTYELNCLKTEKAIKDLPFIYKEIGEERYARTWTIKNSYESYAEYRNLLVSMEESEADYVDNLYKVYEIQEYLQVYAKRLVQSTLTQGNLQYQEKVPTLYRIPLILISISMVMIVALVYLTRLMNQTMVLPVVKLAHMSRKIAKNETDGEDIVVKNKDEIGELVQAFNLMRHSTENYIHTLEEKNRMAELLHKEELEKLEVEKRLDSTQLELLKSQINPHFLFNTLNMICCMANLEDASTTEKMTNSLGNLFRYNLKTTGAEVLLESELKIIEDYMYLQQMRFGNRLYYDIVCQVADDLVVVPTFMLQPLVENAIIHGIAKKEIGGKVLIRIWQKAGFLYISVVDTGIGMDEEKLETLKSALQEQLSSVVGIGLGNIYKRIHMMYPNGDMQIYSKKNCATAVQIRIPMPPI